MDFEAALMGVPGTGRAGGGSTWSAGWGSSLGGEGTTPVAVLRRLTPSTMKTTTRATASPAQKQVVTQANKAENLQQLLAWLWSGGPERPAPFVGAGTSPSTPHPQNTM